MREYEAENAGAQRVSRYHARLAGLFTTKRCMLLMLLAVAGLAIPAWQGWRSYHLVRITETQLRTVIELEGPILYRDEVLTMSARMAAASQDMRWVERYEHFGHRIRPQVEESWRLDEDSAAGEEAVLTVFADDKLTAIETEALELIRQGQYTRATALLASQDYSDQKQAYLSGAKAFVANAHDALEGRRNEHRRRTRNALAAAGICLPGIVLVWLSALAASGNIHDRIERRRKTRAFAREWQDTFNAITDGVCIIDGREGKVVQCNKAMLRFLKRPHDEIVGRSCCELLHGSSEPIKDCPLRSMFETGRSETTEFQTNDHWFSVKVDPLLDEKGRLVGAVHILSDITKHRRATQALRASEEKFRLAFANAHDGIVWIDARTGLVTQCNRSAEELFGRMSGDIIGQRHTTLFPMDWTQTHGPAMDEWQDQASGPIEAQIVRPGGHTRAVTVSVSKMLVDGKETVQCIFRDITESKKAQKEKMTLELQLGQKQKMEAIGTLAGGIAHDFNNILAAIQGYVELSLDGLTDDSPIRSNLLQILSCSDRAAKLIKQILTFSRHDEQEQEMVPLEINTIVKEVLGMLRSSLPATVKIRRKIHAESSVVLADPTQIHQVLVNLCTNASHAMGEKGGLLEVGLSEVTLTSRTHIGDEYLGPGHYVKLSVSDSGCGISPDVIERVFDPFFTTKNVDQGTGLGLSVVHGIVKRHHGAVSVNSTPGQGTTFDIFFPSIHSEGSPSSSPVESSHRDEDVILLVDDEEMMVDVMGQTLRKLGYVVVAKTSSIDALEAFQEEPDKFDLVITDQVMPNMTGTELARNLLSIRPNIPVILCSGFPEHVRVEELEGMGIREFVTKPISREQMADVVHRALGVTEVEA